MQDWQLQAMKERADAEAWEKYCAAYEREDLVKECIRYMKMGCEQLAKVETMLVGVAEDLDGIPESDRIESLRSDVDKIWSELRRLYEDMERRVGN